jgi:hypothetical protein
MDNYIKFQDKDSKGNAIIIPDKTYARVYYKKSNTNVEGLMTFSYLVE